MLDVLEQCALQGVLVRKVADSPRWDHVVDVHHHPQNVRLGELRIQVWLSNSYFKLVTQIFIELDQF